MAPKGLNEEDFHMLSSERDASPQRYNDWDQGDRFERRYSDAHPQQIETPDETTAKGKSEHEPPITEAVEEQEPEEEHEEIEEQEIHPPRASRPRLMSMNSVATQRCNDLERHETALERIDTQRTQHASTVGGVLSNRASRKPLPSFGAGKPYPPNLPDKEEYVVEFDGHDDPLHPQNWPTKKKLYIAAILAWDALAATFGSSVFSNAASVAAAHFNVGSEVGTLGTSLFVLGYAFGPICWAPFSELQGRKLPILFGSFGFGVFSIACAVSKDIQTLIICRFWSGFFGSAPLAVVAAVYSDMFDNRYRGVAVAIFSATVFMGPLLAPFIGGFITISYLGWRWTEYLTAIMAFTAFILALLFQQETYPPIILVDKASELRRRTKNWGIHAKQEEIEVNFRELLIKNVSRPLRILFTEPIVLLITIYMSFIYGLLYLFLTAYALVFQGVYGMNAGVGSLPYFGMVAGEMIAFVVIVSSNPGYVKKLEANNNIPVPEWRLPIVMYSSVLFAGGLFWFGWTGYTGKIHWIVPTLSGLFTGFGIFGIFLSLLNYIVDAYLMFAASAIAGNTFLRSLFGCVFPLFARYMYEGMGIEWASTLIGCVAVIMIPLPFLFYFKGKTIRARSKLAPAPDIEQDKRRDEESRGLSSTESDEEKIEDKKEA